MNKNRSISFIIPAYNCANTITESVESIVQDNYKKCDEIIIVNDKSTDNTAHIIKNLKTKYPFLIIINNDENKGCPATRNIGIKKASNPIIFNLDSDNILSPNSIIKLKQYMIENNADVASFGEMHYFVKNKKKITHKWIFNPGIFTLEDFLSGTINPGPGGNFMYTKKSWHKVGGYWEYGPGLHEAWGYSLKLLATKCKFVIMPNSFYYHRYGHDSLYIREVRKKNASSIMATKMIIPYFNLIDEKNVEYIKNNKTVWFLYLNTHPIKIKNKEYGRNGKIVRSFNYKIIIKKIIARIPLSLKFYYQSKKYISYKNFIKEFFIFKKLAKNKKNRFNINWKNRFSCLNDKTLSTEFDRHYIYHPAWAARILAKTKPKKHIDISSTLHFCSIISAFIPVEFYDYRPAKLNLGNLTSKKADLACLPFQNNSIDSLSCMHTIEHIGLGRYGDQIDPDGDLKAIKELKRVLAINGNLLFVVPVGKPKIMFNAHRIYSFEQIINYFSGLKLEEFTLIPDKQKNDGMIYNPIKELTKKQNYGCGCFWFTKK